MRKFILPFIALSLSFIAQSQQSWSLGGNGGTNPATNFLGTRDNKPLKFRINNKYSGEIDSVTAKTFFGYGAGTNTTTGNSNVAIGYKPLYLNTTGGYNTAIGVLALYSNTTGSYNTANGFNALTSNTTGDGNTAVGIDALYSNTTGTRITAIGMSSQFWNTANDNTAVGFESLNQNTTGTQNTAVGTFALWHNTTGNNNTANGCQALFSNTIGSSNTSHGFGALYANITGNFNTANGYQALNWNTSGESNTAFGTQSLYFNDFGSSNTAIGYRALYSNSGIIAANNTATGYQALYSNIAIDRFIGGAGNTANGSFALRNNTIGIFNTAVGVDALQSNITGHFNTCVGFGALSTTTASDGNTAVGYRAGCCPNNGYYNTFIGSEAQATVPDIYNSTALGRLTYVTAPSQVRIGNSFVTSIGGYADWTNISDGRVKKNMKANVPGLAFINKLQPITYNLDLDAADRIMQVRTTKTHDDKTTQPTPQEMTSRKLKEQITYTGFVAQDVEKAAKEMGFDFSAVDPAKNDKDLYGLRYAQFVVPLVKAVQELSAENEELKRRLTVIEDQLSGKRLVELENNPSSYKGPDVVNIWPNPSHDIVFVNIVSENQTQAQLEIFDIKGELVKVQKTSVLQGDNQFALDMRELANGVYHLSVKLNGQVKKTTQIVKQ